ncbi:MAG: thermonuclease family protein [Candidatus Cloacimonadaceae bacterium]|nr:thermonuclease family protein [Candidatus Cloacimonadaceae bacterium]
MNRGQRAFHMPKIILLAVLIFFANAIFAYNIRGKVVSVKDGDTIEILRDKKTYRIRLNGIDCPENKQDFGNKAKQFTSEQCFGKTVTAWVSVQDRYGRYVADVVLPNGKVLNEELVRAGLAWHYTQYSKSKKLATLEKEARARKRGLWSQKNPTPPWKFRRGGASKTGSLSSGPFVALKNSNTYHKASCHHAKKNPGSGQTYFKSRADAERAGYKACKVCGG